MCFTVSEYGEGLTVIDIHIHLGMSGSGADPESVAVCKALARRAGVGRVVNLTNLGGGRSGVPALDPTPDQVRESNDVGLEVLQRHPDFVIGFCFLNPNHDEQFQLDEIERCVVRGGCRGIKLWISTRASDRRLDPLMARAAELGVPVLQHAWYKATGQEFNESTPADVADLARRHPRTQIIMAHLGGGGRRGVLDVKPYPNVVVDTSGSQPIAGLIEYAVAELGPERVIFGSDWPIRDFATHVGWVRGSEISERDQAAILQGNAMRLLGL